MNNQLAETILRAALARFESESAEAIAVIELYLNNPTGVADHSSVVDEVVDAINRLTNAQEAIDTIHSNFGVNAEQQDD